MKRRRLEVRALPGALLMALTATTAEAGVREVEGVAVEPEEDMHPCLEMMEPCLMVVEAPEPTTLQRARQSAQMLEFIPEEAARKAERERLMLDVLTAYRQLYVEEGELAAEHLREGFEAFEAYAAKYRQVYGEHAAIRPDLLEAAAELLSDLNKARRTADAPPAGDVPGGAGPAAQPPCLTPAPARRGCSRHGSTAALLMLLPLGVRRRRVLEQVRDRLPADVIERLEQQLKRRA